MSPNRFANADDVRTARRILEAIGEVLACKEDALDAVTGLSGSGPAYVFYFIESMIAAGTSLNLSPEDARVLTLQTLKGAVKLLEEGKDSPEELRQKVTSPGGTTEAALNILSRRKVKETFIEAIAAAAKRSGELSSQF